MDTSYFHNRYTKFTCVDGKVTHENIKYHSMGIGIWPNKDGTIELYYETWEDEEMINLLAHNISQLYNNDFEYTHINWTDDNEWEVCKCELHIHKYETLPQFNYVEHDEYNEYFSIVIIGNDEDDISTAKLKIKDLALEYHYDNIEKSEQAINQLLEK